MKNSFRNKNYDGLINGVLQCSGENGDDLILATLTRVDWGAPTKPNQVSQPQRNPNFRAKEIQTMKQ